MEHVTKSKTNRSHEESKKKKSLSENKTFWFMISVLLLLLIGYSCKEYYEVEFGTHFTILETWLSLALTFIYEHWFICGMFYLFISGKSDKDEKKCKYELIDYNSIFKHDITQFDKIINRSNKLKKDETNKDDKNIGFVVYLNEKIINK